MATSALESLLAHTHIPRSGRPQISLTVRTAANGIDARFSVIAVRYHRN
jgi:hypothetical protein